MTDLAKTLERAKLVLEDVPTDAKALDSTPFSPPGVAGALGNLLAMVGALAQCVIELTEEVQRARE